MGFVVWLTDAPAAFYCHDRNYRINPPQFDLPSDLRRGLRVACWAGADPWWRAPNDQA